MPTPRDGRPDRQRSDEAPRVLLEFLARSPNRVTVLGALPTGGSVSRAELQRETGVPRSTLSRILGELAGRGLVSNDGQRYTATPFGGFVADRLGAMFDAIGAVQRLQGLVQRLADADPDFDLPDHPNGELLTPTAGDPRAPARRFADLVAAASHVRLLVPGAVPEVLDVGASIGPGGPTFEIMLPQVVLEPESLDPEAARWLRTAIAAGTVRVYAHDGAFPYLAGTVDETAVVGLTDAAHAVEGYIETRDERVRAWAGMTVEAYLRRSNRLSPRALTRGELPGRCG